MAWIECSIQPKLIIRCQSPGIYLESSSQQNVLRIQCFDTRLWSDANTSGRHRRSMEANEWNEQIYDLWHVLVFCWKSD